MSLISEISSASNPFWQVPKEGVRVQLSFFDPSSPKEVVNKLASVQGPVDVYCWYEGTQGLPVSGAIFMKESLLEPLYEKRKMQRSSCIPLVVGISKSNKCIMAPSTPLGVAINCINKKAVECIFSTSFFRYCTQVSKKNEVEKSELYNFIQKELPNKKWLFRISEKKPIITPKKVSEVFGAFKVQNSLFDCIKDYDIIRAYSAIQYVEGYFLIQESVKRGLLKGQKKIEIAFVLPNDEGKYYLSDYTKDIDRMLQLDFGKELINIEINITFRFFEYGNFPDSRPYIDKSKKKVAKVKPEEIGSYFDYLPKLQVPQTSAPQVSIIGQKMPYFKDIPLDIVTNKILAQTFLNGGY